ncbi:hypothetical protein [Herbidospora solisilvae]|uniref:hypothetical protein n=1 Tax=Herbidospora solisilvae TaxID=2696284 RepID=UPI002E2D2CB2|nr:hypothetical protein [Herbidospora solisilvae]
MTEHLAVRNFSDGEAVFALKAADGYLTDKGRFNMLRSDQASTDGGTWIDVQKEVKVAANATTVVPFTITAPKDAAPGDHPAGVAATVTSAGGTVAVESRVGFRVMMRATGTVRAQVAVTGLTATYEQPWNPFSSGVGNVAEIFPGDSRTVATRIGGVWALGPMSANVTVTPSVEGGTPMSADVTLWTVP